MIRKTMTEIWNFFFLEEMNILISINKGRLKSKFCILKRVKISILKYDLLVFNLINKTWSCMFVNRIGLFRYKHTYINWKETNKQTYKQINDFFYFPFSLFIYKNNA